jgi:hypothetical protein
MVTSISVDIPFINSVPLIAIVVALLALAVYRGLLRLVDLIGI